jgi:hypothetical protein
LAQDPVRELRDLKAVHDFYTAILEKALHHGVPAPQEVQNPSFEPETVVATITVLKHWLNLLDMAIAAPMMRDALNESKDSQIPESLLRYYIFKNLHTALDRDKADFVATYLYRHPTRETARLPAKDPSSLHRPITEQGVEFEVEINLILGGFESLPLSETYATLLREFDFIQEEVSDTDHFDQLMDSGIVERARGIKESLGSVFYHPKALATLAAYNNFFGARFDELFRIAAQQIKSFAAKVQEEGGSIMSRVDGDVIVKHLTEVEESNLMQQEYGRAKENFRKVSKMKKAVDSRRAGRSSGTPASTSSIPSMSRPAPKPKAVKPLPLESLAEAPAFAVGNAIEDAKTRSAMEAIRNFVRAAQSNWDVVPIRDGSLVLSPAEVEAFRSEMTGEKSFRGDYANLLMQSVTIFSRMTTELKDYLAKQDSAYLWKPHADALTYLIAAAGRVFAVSTNLLAVAEQRGLADKAKALSASLDKLRTQTSLVAKSLQS